MKPTTTLVWVSNNRGMLTKIAAKANVSPQFVSMVLYGERSNSLVEKLLRENGAPIANTDREPTAA